MRGHIVTQDERKPDNGRRQPEEPEQKEATSREGSQRAVRRERQGSDSSDKTSGDVKPAEPSMYDPATSYTHEIQPRAAQERDGGGRDMEKEGEWTIGQMRLEFRRCSIAAEWDVACRREYHKQGRDDDGQPSISADRMGGRGAGDWRLRGGGIRSIHGLVVAINVDDVNINRRYMRSEIDGVNIKVYGVNMEPGNGAKRRGRRGSYHHGNLRAALIESATAMIEDGGGEGISLREVAARTGVSQTAPYRHFADKTALLSAVAVSGFQAFAECLDQAIASADEPAERLAAMGRAYVEFAMTRTGMFRLMFLSDLLPNSQDPELGSVAMGTFQRLARVVSACRGDTDSVPRDATAVAAWALIHGLAMLCLYGVVHPDMAGGIGREAIIDQVTRSLTSGVFGPRV